MRLGIVGPGAIGCVVRGLLIRAGHDVTVIDQNIDPLVRMLPR